MKTVFNARAMVWVLSAMAAFAFSPARSVDRLYYFVDERGVSHFSNVPGDSRYRPVPWTENPAAPQSGLASVPDALSVPEDVPRVVEPAVPMPEAAKGLAEPDTAKPVSSQEMLTDETLTPGVEAEPPSGVPVAEAAKGLAEPDTAKPVASQEMFTDETLTPGVEAEPASGVVQPRNR